MSTIKADAVTAKSTNTDIVVTGAGTGVPDIETGFKVSGTAGLNITNLRAGTDGELITWDASGNPATVAVGTATHVLTSNGAGAAPTFQAGGKVLQVVLGTTTTAVAETSGSDTDTTLGATITPADNSNKVLILTAQHYNIERGSNDYVSGKFTLERNIASAGWTDLVVREVGEYANNYHQSYGLYSESWLDSPTSAGSIQYRTTCFRNGLATMNVNSGTSTMILLEIDA